MKSPRVAFVLNFLLPGVGVAYVGQWTWALVNVAVFALPIALCMRLGHGEWGAALWFMLASMSAGFAEAIARRVGAAEAAREGNSLAPHGGATATTEFSSLAMRYRRVVGTVIAGTVGRLDRYSEEHRRFLASGYACPHCRRPLSVRHIQCFDADDKPVSAFEIRRHGRCFVCPCCEHRWPFRCR